jgi:flagellar biosynthesis/type III secretory pathway protein FliH
MKMTVEQLVKKVETLREEVILLEKDLASVTFPITKKIIHDEISQKRDIIEELYVQEVELKLKKPIEL